MVSFEYIMVSLLVKLCIYCDFYYPDFRYLSANCMKFIQKPIKMLQTELGGSEDNLHNTLLVIMTVSYFNNN